MKVHVKISHNTSTTANQKLLYIQTLKFYPMIFHVSPT